MILLNPPTSVWGGDSEGISGAPAPFTNSSAGAGGGGGGRAALRRLTQEDREPPASPSLPAAPQCRPGPDGDSEVHFICPIWPEVLSLRKSHILKLLGCMYALAPTHTLWSPPSGCARPSPRKIQLGGKRVPPEFLEDRQPDDSQTDRWMAGKERPAWVSALGFVFQGKHRKDAPGGRGETLSLPDATALSLGQCLLTWLWVLGVVTAEPQS